MGKGSDFMYRVPTPLELEVQERGSRIHKNRAERYEKNNGQRNAVRQSQGYRPRSRDPSYERFLFRGCRRFYQLPRIRSKPRKDAGEREKRQTQHFPTTRLKALVQPIQPQQSAEYPGSLGKCPASEQNPSEQHQDERADTLDE